MYNMTTWLDGIGQVTIDIHPLIVITAPFKMQSRFKIIGANFISMGDKFVHSFLLLDGRDDLETNEK